MASSRVSIVVAIVCLLVLLADATRVRFHSDPVHLPLGVNPTRVMTKRSMEAASGTGPVVPLNGNLTYWGEYFATIGLGVPEQIFQLQVDTGSADLIVFGKGCKGCNSTALFDMSKSKDNHQVGCHDPNLYCDHMYCYGFNCGFKLDFGDGSGAGGEVCKDKVTVGGLKSKSDPFMGVVMDLKLPPNGEFEPTGVDGLWGMAFHKLSGWLGQTVFDYLYQDFNWYNGFSLCLGQSGGTLSLGANWEKAPNFQWTAITQDIWYTVKMTDIKFNNQSLGVSHSVLNENGVIIDSGTTLFVVNPPVMTAIQNALQAMCSKVNLVGVCGVSFNNSIFNNQCFQMTPAQVAQYPNLTVTLDGTTDLPIPQSQYLWQGAGIPGYYCLGISAAKKLPIILGDVFMSNYNVAFDRNKGKVGFGPISSCPK